MKQPTTNFGLSEPLSPEYLIPEPWLDLWMWIVIAILLLAAVAFFLFRKKKPTPFDVLAARHSAHLEALAELGQIPQTSPRDTAIQSSLILRKYLATVARDPAIFETHEEFISRRDSLTLFTPDARQATASCFATLATLKYAHTDPSSLHPSEITRESQALLHTLNQGFLP